MTRVRAGSSVVLDNVDDYLAPSQACINPLFQPKIASAAETKRADGENHTVASSSLSSPAAVVVPRKRRIVRNFREVEIGTQPTPAPTSIPDPVKKEQSKEDVVKASIADCLACSGCVTTAETVLLEQHHSLTSLKSRLSDVKGQRKRLVVTISPNSWADMSRYWNLPTSASTIGHQEKDEDDNNKRLFAQFTTLLSEILSATAVVDGNVPLQWTWMDEAEEFCQAFLQDAKRCSNGNDVQNSSASKEMTADLVPSVALDSNRTQYFRPDGTAPIVVHDTLVVSSTSINLPVISGSCPALVCLVEKTLTRLVPHLSQSLSPMTMLGMCLKNEAGVKRSKSTSSVHNDDATMDDEMEEHVQCSFDHWAVMPCHDKKLEASRKDFYLANGERGTSKKESQHAVDLVISTQECVELVEEWINNECTNNTGTEDEQAVSTPTVVEYLTSREPCQTSTILEPKELLPLLRGRSKTVKPILISTPLMVRSSQCNHRGSANGVASNNLASEQVPLCSREKSTQPSLTQMAFASGGHANFIFLYAAKKLFGCSLDQVEWKSASTSLMGTIMNVRSARLGRQQKQHFYEARLYRHNDGSYSSTMTAQEEKGGGLQPVLHFAVAHGMQTMQQALKLLTAGDGNSNETNGEHESSPGFHYLEAMACPHGCVNGGGSTRTSFTHPASGNAGTAVAVRETPSETRLRVKRTLNRLDVPQGSAVVEHVPSSTTIQRTRYHVVPPMQHTQGAVAGEKVENMIW